MSGQTLAPLAMDPVLRKEGFTPDRTQWKSNAPSAAAVARCEDVLQRHSFEDRLRNSLCDHGRDSRVGQKLDRSPTVNGVHRIRFADDRGDEAKAEA